MGVGFTTRSGEKWLRLTCDVICSQSFIGGHFERGKGGTNLEHARLL